MSGTLIKGMVLGLDMPDLRGPVPGLGHAGQRHVLDYRGTEHKSHSDLGVHLVATAPMTKM